MITKYGQGDNELLKLPAICSVLMANAPTSAEDDPAKVIAQASVWCLIVLIFVFFRSLFCIWIPKCRQTSFRRQQVVGQEPSVLECALLLVAAATQSMRALWLRQPRRDESSSTALHNSSLPTPSSSISPPCKKTNDEKEKKRKKQKTKQKNRKAGGEPCRSGLRMLVD